jgi:phosphomannomutase
MADVKSLKFGTSGLRGHNSELSNALCYAYATAFLSLMQRNYNLTPNSVVLIGFDLRQSSPRIAAACMQAIGNFGLKVENCGSIPTPALALRAAFLRVPAIMITGSHIPNDRNGLKFYTPDGEINKNDEAAILLLLDFSSDFKIKPAAYPISNSAYLEYEARCLALLPPNILSGLRIGVYQHSSVARDLMVEILTKLGATVMAFASSNIFIPIDTEALSPQDLEFARFIVSEYKLDALISTDGDADRPLIADELGAFLQGDIIGILTAQFWKAKVVVTPITSTSLVEKTGYFTKTIRTKVGSPFVIEEMNLAQKLGHTHVIGFEANGGVLIGKTCGSVPALITRDAMLPILSILAFSIVSQKTISQLVKIVPERFKQSARIETDLATGFLTLLEDPAFRELHFKDVADFNILDGVQIFFKNGDILHYRASGNAPELRCYCETETTKSALELLSWGLAFARHWIGR